jgi:hypothetical protein
MDFVDDIDLIARRKRSQRHMTFEFAHFVHAIVRGTIDLDDIEAFTSGNGKAILALAAGLVPIYGSGTIESLRHQPSDRGFATTPWSGKKIGMPHS